MQKKRLIRMGAEALPYLCMSVMGEAQTHHARIHVQAAAVIQAGSERLADGQRARRQRGAVLLLFAHEALNMPLGLRPVAPGGSCTGQAVGFGGRGIGRVLVGAAGIEGDMAQFQHLVLRLAMDGLAHPAVAHQKAFVKRRAGGCQRQYMLGVHARYNPLVKKFHGKRGPDSAGSPLRQPLTLPAVTPSIRYRLKNRKSRNTGIRDRVDMANMGPKLVPCASAKFLMPRDTVYSAGLVR